MKLEKNVLYNSQINDVAFGLIPRDHLVKILANGRQCGVLLEYHIAEMFEDTDTPEKQGASYDLINPEGAGTIQAKTFKMLPDETFKRGKPKGLKKRDSKRVFTTKSTLWDQNKEKGASTRTGKSVEKIIEDYFEEYDCFMYIDISQMNELKFRFIVVDTSYVKSVHEGGFISINDILNKVEKEVTV